MDVFWWNNPKYLITEDNWKQVIPRKGMSPETYLNTLSRLIIYIGIASWLYFQKPELLIYMLIALFATVIVYRRRAQFFGYVENLVNQESKLSSSTREIIDVENGIEKDDNLWTLSRDISVTTDMDIPDNLLVPQELFDKSQGSLDLKPHNDNGIKSSIETNGLPHDNQPGMGVIPAFDLRDSTSVAKMPSTLLNTSVTEAQGNHLASCPAPKDIDNAFKMGDRLGDNIRRDPDVHSPSLKCTPAIPNNPFGNILPTDIVNNPARGPPCPDGRNAQDNNWSLGLFRNVNDVWDVNNGQMSYNTLPNITVPNDQNGFAQWCWGPTSKYSCKGGDMNVCYGIDEIQTRKSGQILSRT